MIRALCVLSILLLSACQHDNEDSPEEDAGHPDNHVRIWVSPHHSLPPDSMLKGCESWDESGVGCDLVMDIEESDVQIYVDPSPCTPDANGSVTLAYAACCGPIVFYSECFKYKDGSWDKTALATVASHEIGHQFGLWWHISRSCQSAPLHPSGDSVCGIAVMNPYYDSKVPEPNFIDELAFDIRESPHSVVDARNHHAEDSETTVSFACEYKTRP